MNFYFYFFSTCVIESREDATGFELKREQIMIDIDFSKIKKLLSSGFIRREQFYGSCFES